ncbi:MAG: cAMP-binding protein, partial [Treponema sp.]|nr:cAMP-binding protein [Treponema sp.]
DFNIKDKKNLFGNTTNEIRNPTRQRESDQNVKVKAGKIVVPDVEELIKQAAFYRKQNSKHANEQ